MAPLDLRVLGAVGEEIGDTDLDGNIAFFGNVDHGGLLEVVLLRDVGDFKVGTLTWVVSNFSDVEPKAEVTHGDVVNVFGALMEGCPNFRGVAVRAVDAVVPVAEITRGGVERRGLEVGVLRHVGHHLAVVAKLLVVGALAVGAVAPWPEDEFGVGVMGER